METQQDLQRVQLLKSEDSNGNKASRTGFFIHRSMHKLFFGHHGSNPHVDSG
jgi:hypothetical protein